MQQIPLLATKLYIPRVRSDLVSRPRLIQRLNTGQNNKLTLVSAPAGFGKTTLVIDWLANNDWAISWISLDDGDNDLNRFLTYLISALQTIEQTIGQGLLAVLQSTEEINTEAVLTTLLNEIENLADNTVVVLDDYHVIESRSIDQALTFLLDYLPPQLHLVIISRTDPSLPLSRLRARGQMTEIRERNLRFTTDEVTTFLTQVLHSPISSDIVYALEERTEGWITGLRLAATAMQGLNETNQITGFIQNFSGSHRYVIDYLIDEVLDLQTPSIQKFLIETSILDRMTASLCDAVSNSEDGQATLEYLETSNLFIIPLDDERRWYRYHHLFSDLLLQRLQHTLPEMVPVLHKRASMWYTNHNMTIDAVHHALAGEHFEKAADLIETDGLRMIGQGAFNTVRNWIDTLPKRELEKRPYLCVYQAWALNFTHQLDIVEDFLHLAQCALQKQDMGTDNFILSDIQGHIDTLRAWNARRQRDNNLAIDLLKKASNDLGDRNPMVRTFTDLNLGLAYIDNGELNRAADALRSAVSLGRVSQNQLASLNATSQLAAVLILQGRLHESAHLCRKTIQAQLERYGQPIPTMCMIYLRLGWILAEWNDIDGFFSNLAQCLVLADQIGYESVVRVCSWTMVWEKQLLAEQGTVIEFSDDVNTIINRVYTVESPAKGTPRPSENDEELSAIEAQNVEAYLADDAYFEIWPGYSEHARATRLVEEGKVEQALDNLSQIYESARKVEGIGLMIETRSTEALIYHSQGNLDRALEALADALFLGKPEGYIRTFADRGAPMAKLIYLTNTRGIMPDYTAKILTVFGEQGQAAVDYLKASPGKSTGTSYAGHSPSLSLVEPLSQRELEILHLISRGYSNREICEKLFLALSTVKGHNRNIYGKLQVKRRTEAVVKARELHLL